MGRLQKSDSRISSRAVFPYRTRDLLRNGAALVSSGAGVAPYQASLGPAQSSRSHIIRQQALPRCRSQQDQAGASVQV